jgi:hypothetical protein
MTGPRLTIRSPKLNRHPGLYLRLWGKWYRVVKWGGQ